MTRVFKTRRFARWMSKTQLEDATLCGAIGEMSQGLIDADLGGGVVKKRVALPGRGKRGSSRVLVATNKGDRWFFVFGFEKNQQGNISAQALKALQMLAADLLRLSPDQLEAQLRERALQEICHAD